MDARVLEAGPEQASLVARIEALDTTLFSLIDAQSLPFDQRALLGLHGAAASVHGTFGYLEVGSYLGGSLQALMRDRRCTGVLSLDARTTATAHGPDGRVVYTHNSTENMLSRLRALPDVDMAKLHTIDTSVAYVTVRDIPLQPAYCFIDGEHTDEAVLRDARFCAEAMSGSGVLVFHDYGIVAGAIATFVREHRRDMSFALAFTGPPDPLVGGGVFALELGPARLLRSPIVTRAISSRWHATVWRAANRVRGSALPLLTTWAAVPAVDLGVAELRRGIARYVKHSPVETRDRSGIDAGDHNGRAAPPAPEIPYPTFESADVAESLEAALSSPAFAQCDAYFCSGGSPDGSLLSGTSQAVLYTIARNLKPEHVVEIGTYKAGTTRVLVDALHANGLGIVHTVDPYCADEATARIAAWPAALRARVALYGTDSMSFFADTFTASGLRPGLVLVDGNHDYEFAAFDIACAVRAIAPGGVIVVDNVDQAGPYYAVRDFLRSRPDWREAVDTGSRLRPELPFDRDRPAIPAAGITVLQGPTGVRIGARPVTIGEKLWPSRLPLAGVVIEPTAKTDGRLYVQAVFRTFTDPPTELSVEVTEELSAASGERMIPIPNGWSDEDATRRVEVWLGWEGSAELQLSREPALR